LNIWNFDVHLLSADGNCQSFVSNLISVIYIIGRSGESFSNTPTSTSPPRCLQFDHGQIHFITLTFPNAPTEEKAKSALKKYLATARTLGIDYYFWTLEKSGMFGDNIHFHLLIQCPNATLKPLADRWDKITNSTSPHSTNAQKVYDHKGMIEYLLKGHEHERLGRQFGMSRPLADFKPIKLNDFEQRDFIEENEEDLRLFAVKDYYTILFPTPKLRKKIIGHYLSRCINRKSEKYEKEKLKCGGTNEKADD
jgi:hypothetical protein